MEGRFLDVQRLNVATLKTMTKMMTTNDNYEIMDKTELIEMVRSALMEFVDKDCYSNHGTLNLGGR